MEIAAKLDMMNEDQPYLEPCQKGWNASFS
jgi:hypothetical protein